MKPLYCLVAMSLICCCLQAQTPADPAKIANIEEIFKLTRVDQMQQTIFAQMRAMTTAQLDKMPNRPKDTSEFQEVQDRMFALLTDKLGWTKLKPRYVALYDETFTAQEITGILDFYRSPAGTAMLQKMPVLMSKSMALSQTLLGDYMPELQSIMEEVRAKHKGDNASPNRP